MKYIYIYIDSFYLRFFFRLTQKLGPFWSDNQTREGFSFRKNI